MLIRIKLIIVFFACMISSLVAQSGDSDAYRKLKFIKRNLNKIENDSIALQSFYEKLHGLKIGTKQHVSIIHIGDSHIQADVFSGVIRQKMQLHFGNAGRGLIFPYRVAKTNEPYSYKTTTNKSWKSKRNTFLNDTMPIGISGFSIETTDTAAKINLTIKDQPGLGYGFTKLSLFHDKGANNYNLIICDENSCERAVFKTSDPVVNPFVSVINFETPVHQIVLKSEKTDSVKQNNTRIYGILLENDSSGILYNTIAANGAEFRHYNAAKYFTNQLSYLKPDLIIISLGTNDAYGAGFNPKTFYDHIDTLVTNIRLTNPDAYVLLTTPPDSFRKTRRGRVKNPNMKGAQSVIVHYCLQHNLPYWDLYEIMGGFGSMAKWYSAGFAAKDRVHFTGKGYLIQGNLFYDALMKGYAKYVKEHYK